MDAIKLRKDMKKKRPKFKMTSFGKLKRIKDKWRKPKGSDNKMKHGLKGYSKKIKIGYKGPKEVRGMHPSGVKIVNVNNVNELNGVDAKVYGVYISRTVGKKKKLDIIKKCQELGIQILNFKADEYVKKVKEELEARKSDKKKRSENREKKKKEKEKKAAEKEKKETKGEEKQDLAEKVEEEKEKENQEKQKVLTKKE